MHASLAFLTMLLSNSRNVKAASAQLHLHTVSLHRHREGCVHPLTQDTEGLQKHAAQHSTAQHSTAQHSTAQQNLPLATGHRRTAGTRNTPLQR